MQYPRKTFSLAALGLGLVAAACQWIVGIEGDLRVSASDGGTATDAGAEAQGPDPCLGEGVPSAPVDAPGGGDISVVFALRSLDFGIDGGAPVGLNLDGRCTCPGLGSCRPPGTPPCDQERGIDNGSRDLLARVFTLGVLDQSMINTALQQGEFGVLVQIDGWNGQPNDSQVRLQVLASQGFDKEALPGRSQPVFDGNDTWSVDEESVLSSVDGGPPYVSVARDPDAFVAGGALVGLLSFPIVVGSSFGQQVRIDVNDGRVFASIRADKGVGDAGVQYSLRGTLAGRWPATALLTSLASLDALGTPLCGDSGVYQEVKKLVCERLDIPAKRSNDDLGQTCSAISLGATFVAVNAKLGHRKPKPDGGGCGPNWSDTCP